MAQLIQPQKIKVLTKDGECEITLNVNIVLDHRGLVPQISVDSPQAATILKQDKPPEPEFKWEIPNFDDGSEKIQFGKEVSE